MPKLLTTLKRTDFSIYQRSIKGTSSHYIPGLDGLRAISVLLVVIAHAGFARYVPGDLGVTVFFFISGFLITNLLISEIDASRTINIQQFYIRRYLRLSPELYFFVLVCTLVSFQFYSVPWLDTLGSLFYFQNYVRIFFPTETPDTPLTFSHLWSLSVEEHFYLIMPSFIWMFRRRLDVFFWVLVALCIIAPAYRLFAFEYINPQLESYASIYTDRATETRFDSIIYGCLLALFARKGKLFGIQPAPVTLLLLLCSALGILLSILLRTDLFKHVWKFTVQGIALFAGTYALYTAKDIVRPIFQILESNLFRVTGRLSYGIYRWHLFPIWFMRHAEANGTFPDRDWRINIAIVIGSLIFSYVAAYISEQALLRPISKLRRRFGSAVAN